MSVEEKLQELSRLVHEDPRAFNNFLSNLGIREDEAPLYDPTDERKFTYLLDENLELLDPFYEEGLSDDYRKTFNYQGQTLRFEVPWIRWRDAEWDRAQLMILQLTEHRTTDYTTAAHL